MKRGKLGLKHVQGRWWMNGKEIWLPRQREKQGGGGQKTSEEEGWESANLGKS